MKGLIMAVDNLEQRHLASSLPEEVTSTFDRLRSLGENTLAYVMNVGHEAGRIAAIAAVSGAAMFTGQAIASPETTSSGQMQPVKDKIVYKQTPKFKFNLLGPSDVSQIQQGEVVKYKATERNNTSTARKVLTDIYWQEKPNTVPKVAEFTEIVEPHQTKSKIVKIVAPRDTNSTWTAKDHFDIQYYSHQEGKNGRISRMLYKALFKVGYLQQ